MGWWDADWEAINSNVLWAIADELADSIARHLNARATHMTCSLEKSTLVVVSGWVDGQEVRVVEACAVNISFTGRLQGQEKTLVLSCVEEALRARNAQHVWLIGMKLGAAASCRKRDCARLDSLLLQIHAYFGQGYTPIRTELCVRLGETFEALGEFAEAAKAYSEIVNAEPRECIGTRLTRGRACGYLALALKRDGQFTVAEKEYKRAIHSTAPGRDRELLINNLMIMYCDMPGKQGLLHVLGMELFRTELNATASTLNCAEAELSPATIESPGSAALLVYGGGSPILHVASLKKQWQFDVAVHRVQEIPWEPIRWDDLPLGRTPSQFFTTSVAQSVAQRKSDLKCARQQRASSFACDDTACAACGLRAIKGKQMNCGRCKMVFYCNADCQKSHWKKEHKLVCKPTKA